MAKWFLGSHGGPRAPTGGKYLGHLSGICKKLKVCRDVCCYIVNNKPNQFIQTIYNHVVLGKNINKMIKNNNNNNNNTQNS